MSRHILSLAGMALLALAGVSATAAVQQEIKPTREWKGSVADEQLAKLAPANHVISDAKTFATVWEAWRKGEKVPEIDFKKEIVLAATTRGSRLSTKARMDANGDLKVAAISTRDLRPGFRYELLAIPLEGVKTVNGKKLGGS